MLFCSILDCGHARGKLTAAAVQYGNRVRTPTTVRIVMAQFFAIVRWRSPDEWHSF